MWMVPEVKLELKSQHQELLVLITRDTYFPKYGAIFFFFFFYFMCKYQCVFNGLVGAVLKT